MENVRAWILCGWLFGLFALVQPACAQNWVQTSAPNTNFISVASSADGTMLVAAALSGFIGGIGQVYTSGDSGATWDMTSAPATNWHTVVSSADGSGLAVAV